MITITLGKKKPNYAEDLLKILERGRAEVFRNECINALNCKACEHKEACADISRAIKFLETKCEELQKK